MQDPQQQPPPRADYARTWRRYLRFFGPKGVADLDDELRFHIEMRVRDYMASGMSEAEARAATVQRLGDLTGARDTCVAITQRRQRRMTRAQLIDALAQDARFALRSLRRQKGWTAVAVLTLALGIGANSAMFSVLNHLLLNPIPYPHADRIVTLFQEPSEGNNTGMNVMITPMGRLTLAWKANARSFEGFEPYRTTDVTVERPGEKPRIAHTASIQPSFARFAGQRPIVGRMFAAEEAQGEAAVVMLSEGFWRAQFGSDPAILGKAITVDNKPLTIIGVMPGVFQLPRSSEGDMDLWLPLDLARHDDDGFLTVARLRPGVSRAAAARELDDIARRPEVAGKNHVKYRSKLVLPGEMVGYQDSIILLSVAVALVLLIACANVAHLLLARASTRQREMAIRAALGAGTGRLFRQLLTESLMLAIAGCVGGLLVGWLGLRLLVGARPDSLSDLAAAKIDGTTLLVTIVLAVLTGIAFGLIGAIQASRHSTHDALKAGTLATSQARSRSRLRSLLVVTEMALSTMLLVGAALLLRSVIHLQTRDAGFNPKGLYSLQISLPDDRYTTPTSKAMFFTQLATRARNLPGVVGAAIASAAPPQTSFMIGVLQLEGQPDPDAGATSFIPFNGVEPNYFKLLGLRIVEGTIFTDTTDKAAQVIVNQGMARKYWPGQSALGRRLRISYNGQGKWMTIVGVAADAYTGGPKQESSRPVLYAPAGFFRTTIVVRTASGASFISSLGQIVAEIDPHLPPPQLTSIEEAMQKTFAAPRFTMFLLMVFTVVAVGLAAIGLYGVLAYSVAQRTREIGIRMALGASRRAVATSVMRQGLVLAGIGAALGLAAARGSVRLIGSMLYGVERTDPIAFSAGVVLLLVIALTASLVPMRRALAVDPSIAMRAD